jgi:hypothetical protein
MASIGLIHQSTTDSLVSVFMSYEWCQMILLPYEYSGQSSQYEVTQCRQQYHWRMVHIFREDLPRVALSASRKH